MEENNINNLKPELVDKIISVAYGDASITERIIINWQASRNDEVRKVLKEYKETASSVHNIKNEELPQQVINSVHRRVEPENESENLLSKIYFALFSKPIFSAAVVSIFVLAIISMFLFKQPAVTHKYSNAEIELAQQQLEDSFTIVSRVFNKAEQNLIRKL